MNCSIVMDEVVIWIDSKFKIVLHNLREGIMNDRSTYFLLKICMDILCVEEQQVFERIDIYLMPILSLRRSIMLKHLYILEGLYDVIR